MKHAVRLVTTGLLAVFLAAPPAAQAHRNGLPPSLSPATASPAPKPVTMPPVDPAPYLAEDALRDRLGVGPVRFAIPLETSIEPSTAGVWSRLPDGRWSWRLAVESAGALSLNLALRGVSLPEGAVLWLHDGRGDVVQGPFTAGDLTPRGELWTPVVPGDRAVLEAVMPETARNGFALEVFRVNHGYRFLGPKEFKSGACNVDVVCPEGDPWRDQIRSVGWYTLEGWGTCSGYLVNNVRQNRTPYFLTADHCGVRDNNADTMVFYWNFQSPTCGQHGGGSLEDNQSGAIFRSTWSTADTTLVQLEEAPDPSFDLYLVGFDASGATPQTGAVTIHHPNLDEKSISIDDDPLTSDLTHWQLQWDVGTTEPGSSGSLLLNRDNGLAIGVLTGGQASCSNPLGYDYYGKLSLAWDGGGMPSNSVKAWLDPDDTGTLQVGGMEASGGGPQTGYWLPIVAGLPGQAGSVWRTDVVLLNLGTGTATVDLTLHLAGGTRSLQRQVPAGGQTVVEDIVGAVGAQDKGPAQISSTQPLAVTARVYNLGGGGTFGQFFRGVAAGSGIASGEQAMLPGLRQQEGAFRTNLAVANSGGSEATVRITLYDGAGSQLWQYLVQVPAAGLVQDLEPFKNRAGRPNLGWGFAKVEVTAGSGVLVSASVVDSRTNDATTVEP